jgi:hypothetical protein
MDILEVFIMRMKKLNIYIDISYNYPWVYIDKINDKKVEEKFYSKHGFTIAFMPIKKDKKIEFTDIGEVFRLVRKYYINN